MRQYVACDQRLPLTAARCLRTRAHTWKNTHTQQRVSRGQFPFYTLVIAEIFEIILLFLFYFFARFRRKIGRSPTTNKMPCCMMGVLQNKSNISTRYNCDLQVFVLNGRFTQTFAFVVVFFSLITCRKTFQLLLCPKITHHFHLN